VFRWGQSRRGLSGVPKTQSGERIYAIGDVHGRYDLLRPLMDKLEEHNNALPPVETMHIVFLGDLIDRGSQSSDVMRYVHDMERRFEQIIVLLGNHEEMMVRALDGEATTLRAWLRAGGRATLRSFGIEMEPDEEADRLIARANAAIPREWMEWLRQRPLTARSGDYFFCHAGIRPGRALNRQSREDLLWIRDQFLEDDTMHGAVIVHGHSVANEVEMRANRIGIDTGAYRTDTLTALYLDGTQREIISTAA
jgi:serine/threonine protein phosphatase 1